jgi:outer membrane protein OmpA-like peptidoglycan-associated protein
VPRPADPRPAPQQPYDELSEQERNLLLRLRERELSAHVSVRGTVVILPDTLFAFGGPQLTAAGKRRVETLAETLIREAPDRHVHVEGHTDSIGAELFNQGLSERRAESVALALIAAGVEESLVDHRGYGATFPIAPNSNPDGSDNPPGRTRNRRVEVVITEE